MKYNQLICGGALETLRTLPDQSIQCCVTSPPYWGLRDYGVEGQLGLEKTPEEYTERLTELFREVRRVLRDDGTLWLNLGDTYNSSPSNQNGRGGTAVDRPKYKTNGMAGMGRQARKVPGLKPKDLVGIPWRAAFALQADGWYLRSDIIWSKTCCMPESVTDRPTKSHEHIFLMSKSKNYYYDSEAIKEKLQETTQNHLSKYIGSDKSQESTGRNKRDVWSVATQPYPEAHFATFPEELIIPCIKAGCPEGGIVLDPFMGSGTTALVALKLGRKYLGIELNPEYIKLAEKRLKDKMGLFL